MPKKRPEKSLRWNRLPNNTKLAIPETEKRAMRSYIPIFRIGFLLVALLIAIGGIISLRSRRLSQSHSSEEDIHSLLDLMEPPSPNLVTKLHDKQPKDLRNLTPGNLSYSKIEKLLESQEVVIVENASQRKSSAFELRKKDRQIKNLISAGITDSSIVAQAYAIKCLQHPAVNVKIFEKSLETSKAWRDKLDPTFSAVGGFFHAPNATLCLMRNQFPYQIISHELAHCGSAAMGVNGQQLPFSQREMAKTFPCENEIFFRDAREELQDNILKYRSIQSASESRILTLAKTDSGLNKLLSTADYFKPLYTTLIPKAEKDKHHLERGSVIPHESFIRRLWPIFPVVRLPKEMLDAYKKAASSSPFKIAYVDEYSVAHAGMVLVLGTPTELSRVTRAQLLVLEAQAAEQYVSRYSPSAQCAELFASLVGSFPDEVLRILLPNAYERLFQAVDPLRRPVVPADYDSSGNERIETRTQL